MEGDEAYESCEWIEGGLAFNRRSLHACLIVHHQTGLPLIADYNGGDVPLEAVLALRERVRAANRYGGGHPECHGCPHLRKRVWPRPRYPIEIVGIAHYAYCNIQCSYCFLQTQDPASFAAGLKPYSLLPVIRGLIRDRHLAPDAIIDWGGGEPTSYPEFDELLQLLLAHGTIHYLHTNGTRFPKQLRDVPHPERVHAICSVDAGLRETYVRIKKRDYLERVWANLTEYVRVGAVVSLKYIVKEENAGAADLRAFVARAARLGPRELIVDIDYDFPVPGAAVLAGLARLKALALAAGVPTRFGFTGANFAPEHRVEDRLDGLFREEQARLGQPGMALGRFAGLVQRWRQWHRPRWPWRRYATAWLGHDLPPAWPEGGLFQGTVRLRNDGRRPWRASHPRGRCVDLMVQVDHVLQSMIRVPHDVAPGQEVRFAFPLRLPAGGRGPSWRVKLSLVEQGVAYFDWRGDVPLTVDVRKLPAWRESAVEPPTPEVRPEETVQEGPCHAVPQARTDQSAGVGRRLWHLPVTDGPRDAGH
jgi:hypothetical protein